MQFPIYQTIKLSSSLGKAISAALFALSICLIMPSFADASGFNVTPPQAPPVVGQRPVTDSGLRSTWTQYFAPTSVWTGRRGVDSRQQQDPMQPILPGWGR